MANTGWFVSGFTTAVAVACEKYSASGANTAYASGRNLVLRGYAVQSGSSIAASTVMATLRMGSASFSIANDTPEFDLEVSGLNLESSYFGIAAGSTHAHGLVASIWGDYA